eukprot:1693765-Pleurochrysis_carterae.AAC.1
MRGSSACLRGSPAAPRGSPGASRGSPILARRLRATPPRGSRDGSRAPRCGSVSAQLAPARL